MQTVVAVNMATIAVLGLPTGFVRKLLLGLTPLSVVSHNYHVNVCTQTVARINTTAAYTVCTHTLIKKSLYQKGCYCK